MRDLERDKKLIELDAGLASARIAVHWIAEYEKLRLEDIHAREERNAYMERAIDLSLENRKLKEQVKIMQQTLHWYADPVNYLNGGGERARVALDQTGGWKHG